MVSRHQDSFRIFSEEFESKKVWTPKQEAFTEERGQIRVETQHSARWNKGVRSANVNLNDADCSRNGMNMDSILPRFILYVRTAVVQAHQSSLHSLYFSTPAAAHVDVQ